MTIREYSKNYSNYFGDESVGNIFPTDFDIYQKSKIDWDTLYKSIAIISVESSNSFHEIENMEFFKYYAISKYIIEYLEEKAKRENGEGNENNATEQHNNMLSQAKSNMSGMTNSFKMPNMSKFK